MTKSYSAYLGSQENDTLQRVYGVSFPSAKQLKSHMKMLADAKERDHRRIGKQQQLFFFDAMASPGLITIRHSVVPLSPPALPVIV